MRLVRGRVDVPTALNRGSSSLPPRSRVNPATQPLTGSGKR